MPTIIVTNHTTREQTFPWEVRAQSTKREDGSERNGRVKRKGVVKLGSSENHGSKDPKAAKPIVPVKPDIWALVLKTNAGVQGMLEEGMISAQEIV